MTVPVHTVTSGSGVAGVNKNSSNAILNLAAINPKGGGSTGGTTVITGHRRLKLSIE